MVITVTNQKGGVGKTSVTFNLGAGLAALGHQVAIVDADPGGGLTYIAGFHAAGIIPEVTTAAVLRGHRVPMQAVSRNLQMVVSTPPAMLDLEREWMVEGLSPVSESLRELAEIVIIDSPPNLGAISIGLLQVSDALLIPFLAEDASLGPLDFLLETIEEVNSHVKILGAIPTMTEVRRRMTSEVIAEVAKRGLRILTGIPRQVHVASAPRYGGKSIFDYAPRTAAADAFRALSEEVDQLYGQSSRDLASVS